MHDPHLRAEALEARDHLDAMGDEPERPSAWELAELERETAFTPPPTIRRDGWTYPLPPMAGGSPELDEELGRTDDRPAGARLAGDSTRADHAALEEVRDAVRRADEVLDLLDSIPIRHTAAAYNAARDQRLAALERAITAIREAIA